MIESFLPDTWVIVLLGPIATVIALSVLARKWPDLGWLLAFSWNDRREAKRKQQGQGSTTANIGLEMITFGLGAPGLFFATSMSAFNNAETGEILLVLAFSVGLITLGGRLYARANRQKSNVVEFPVRPEADEPHPVRKIANG